MSDVKDKIRSVYDLMEVRGFQSMKGGPRIFRIFETDLWIVDKTHSNGRRGGRFSIGDLGDLKRIDAHLILSILDGSRAEVYVVPARHLGDNTFFGVKYIMSHFKRDVVLFTGPDAKEKMNVAYGKHGVKK